MLWTNLTSSPRQKKESSIFTRATSALYCRLFVFIFGLTALAFLWKSASRGNPYLIVTPAAQNNAQIHLESDQEKLVDVIIESLKRLGISDSRRNELRPFLLDLKPDLCDRYGFEMVHNLRTDRDLRNSFEAGKLTPPELIKEKFKYAQPDNVLKKKSDSTRIESSPYAQKPSKTVRSTTKGKSAAKFGQSFSSASEIQITQPEKAMPLPPPADKKSKGKDNLLLTTYFVTQRDPNHPDTPMNLSMPAIDDFLETTKPFFHEMHAVIFVDFTTTPEDTGIEFIYTEWEGVPYSINDYRYFLYLDYIKTHKPYEQILIVDMKDVKYGRDPWKYFKQSDKPIFIGSEPVIDITWMKRRQRKCWGKGSESGPPAVVKVMKKLKPRKKEYIMTNAGILGGTANEVIPIVEEMVDIFNNTNQNYRCNSNMVVFAGIVYPRWVDGKVETGQPLHSPFREFLPVSSDYVFFHK